jgi:glycosyltransferase involved in cell wall biosynthesis
MVQNPSLAVIVPTRDRTRRLEDALTSIENQTYDNVEIVVIDGGDGDKVPESVAAVQRRNTNIDVHYVNNENPVGVSAARNQGIELADSEYIAFLDDDDRWHPEKIERQVNKIQHSGDFDAIYCGFRSRTDDGTHIHTKIPSKEGDIFEDLLVRDIIGPPSTVVVDRMVLEDVGNFRESLVHHEDWEFYLRLARDHKIGCISSPLVERTVHSGSESYNVENQKRAGEKILNMWDEELRRRGLRDSAWATFYCDLGVMYCRTGSFNRGRSALRRSLQYDYRTGTAILYLSSLLGRNAFEALKKGKRTIVTNINDLRGRREC